jgi:hypothetical protein
MSGLPFLSIRTTGIWTKQRDVGGQMGELSSSSMPLP